MARITAPQQAEIVTMLAQYYRPKEILRYFKEEYNIELPPPQVTYYNPERNESENLSQDLKELFYAVRQEYINKQADLGLYNRNDRMRRLQKALHKIEDAFDKAIADGKHGSAQGYAEQIQNILKQARDEAIPVSMDGLNGASGQKQDLLKTELAKLFGSTAINDAQAKGMDITALTEVRRTE